MNGDTFINTSKNSAKSVKEDENNFFIKSSAPIQNPFDTYTEPVKHINDYDSNILSEDAYKEVSDEALKLEYKISKIEEELKAIDSKIQSAVDINDYMLAESIRSRKIQLEDELKDLIRIYREASLSTKISGGFSLKNKLDEFKKTAAGTLDLFISKLPGKFSAFVEIKNSLNKLESINKSVDELVSSKYPYGEAGDKYTQLSRYIAKANSIHAEISKFIK